MFDSAGLRVLPHSECLELLRSVPIGRIVYSEHAMPAIQPVSFILFHGQIVIRTPSGSKLCAAARNAVVAFEVDSFAADLRSGRSVTVLGHAAELTDPSELTEVRALGLRLWSPVRVDHFIKIEMEIVSGRALPDSPPADSLEQVVTPESGGSSATLGTHRAMSRGDLGT